MITTALLSKRVSVGPFQITVIRSSIVLLLVLLFMNIKIKKYTFDSLKGKTKGFLIFRCVQSGIVIITKTVLSMNLSLTVLSMDQYLQPIFVVLIAYFLLKEKLKFFEFLITTVTCIALGVIIYDRHKNNEDPIDFDQLMFYILLFIQVLLYSGGTVALRKLKKCHEIILIWYTNWVTLTCSLVLIYATGNDLSIIYRLNLGDWFLIVLTVVSSIVKSICKIKALKL